MTTHIQPTTGEELRTLYRQAVEEDKFDGVDEQLTAYKTAQATYRAACDAWRVAHAAYETDYERWRKADYDTRGPRPVEPTRPHPPTLPADTQLHRNPDTARRRAAAQDRYAAWWFEQRRRNKA